MTTFDEDATCAMGHAYELARGERPKPQFILELIAKRILECASAGERNPVVLANAALDWLGAQRVAEELVSELPASSLELGVRLIRAFGKISLGENRIALVELAEKLAGEKTIVNRL